MASSPLSTQHRGFQTQLSTERRRRLGSPEEPKLAVHSHSHLPLRGPLPHAEPRGRRGRLLPWLPLWFLLQGLLLPGPIPLASNFPQPAGTHVYFRARCLPGAEEFLHPLTQGEPAQSRVGSVTALPLLSSHLSFHGDLAVAQSRAPGPLDHPPPSASPDLLFPLLRLCGLTAST